jgi:trigger factor
LKIDKEFTNDHQVNITAEFDTDLYEQYKRRAARKLSEKNKIAGFRPGKAPYGIVLSQFGEYRINQEAIDLMLEFEYPKVIDEAGIKPSGSGSLEEIKNENPPIFLFKIPLEPVVKLGNYKDLQKPYEPEQLEEKKVDDYIYQLRRNAATIVPSKGKAIEGDLIYFSITAEDKNRSEEDGKILIENQPQQVLIPSEVEERENEWPFRGFTRKLIGKTSGDVFEISHKYSKDDPNEIFQEKSVLFKVSIQEVKSLELPELNGEFVQTLGDYKSVEQLKDDINNRMTQDLTNAYNDRYFLDLIDQIRSKSTIKYPPQVLEQEIDKVIDRVERDLKRQNLDLETYLKLRKTDKTKFIEEEAKPAAIHRLERSLVMDAFAEAEGIKLTDEILDSSIKEVISELSEEGNIGGLQKQMGEQSFSSAVTMEAANRALNIQIHDRLKQIATGAPKPVKTRKTKPLKPKVEASEIEENSQSDLSSSVEPTDQ